MANPPKKRSSKRKKGMRRSHHVRKLAKRVNAISPVKVKLGKKAQKKLKEEHGADA